MGTPEQITQTSWFARVPETPTGGYVAVDVTGGQQVVNGPDVGHPVDPAPGERQTSTAGAVEVWFSGQCFPASPVARGAAFELFAKEPGPGFLPNPRPGASWPYRRFVHATQVVTADAPPGEEGADLPLHMPVSPAWTYESVRALTQIPLERHPAGAAALVAAIRRTVELRRGTSMMKVLSARQVAGYLAGWPLTGFCHREYDLAHLRTPADLGPLGGSSNTGMADDVVFALRWRAVDPLDYMVPFTTAARPVAAGEADLSGLVEMPASMRTGLGVLGTGFTLSTRHLVPEWTVADFVDLPMPAGAKITAFTNDGTEIMLYSYQPDQHAWVRMCGSQWLGLLERIPVRGSRRQELFPIQTPANRLVGRYQGQIVEVVADPPHEFRTAAKARAARHAVDAVSRRVRYVRWRSALCTLVRTEEQWHQVRLCRPDAETVARLGATCGERGVYETWAPDAETSDWHDVEFGYKINSSGGAQTP